MRYRDNNRRSNIVFCMRDTIKSLCENSYVIWAMYALMALVIAIPIAGSILKSGVGCDSAYYICTAERITEGYVPYTGLGYLGYTPLWFYIEAGYKLLFHIPNGVYWPYLILFYAFQIAGAYFLYRLIRNLDINKHIALFSAWLYLLMAHWLDGNSVLLEVPSISFCLLACWLVLEFKDKNYWHYLWIGCLAACSFMVKQYGLGTFALCLYLMLFISKANWKQYITYIAGYIFPIVVCLICWGEAFTSHVFFGGYGTQTAADAGYEVSLGVKMLNIFGELNYFCYMICPIVYFGWMFAVKAYQQNRLAYLIFAYCGILGFSLSFYFTGGQLHYYQYLLPFAVMMIAELLYIVKGSKWRYVLYVLIFWVLFVTFYKTYYNRVYKQYLIGTQRIEQKMLAEDVSKYIKNNEKLFIIHGGLYHLYFTADIFPPNMETNGYSFGPLGLNERTAANQINSADWVIRYSHDYDHERFFTDSLKKELEQYPTIILQDSAILLHKMH